MFIYKWYNVPGTKYKVEEERDTRRGGQARYEILGNVEC